MFCRLFWLALLVFTCAADRAHCQIIPISYTNLVGGTITVGSGLQGDLGYQWFEGTTNGAIALQDGGQIQGSQTATLTINDLMLTNTGTYFLTTTAFGFQTNQIFILYVVAQPEIQKLDYFIVGNSLTFQVEATGGLLSYQWSWQGNPITGATNSTLTFVDADTTANAGYYSVAVTNVLGQTNSSLPGILFTKPTPAGTYQGLFFNDAAPTLESSGWFQFTLSASKRSFSGKLTITNSTYPFSGSFSLDHVTSVTVATKKNAEPLDLILQMTTTNDAPQVVGTVSNSIWSASVRGNRLFLNAPTNSPLAGSYTVAFANTNLSSAGTAPDGNGYGVVTISKSRALVMKGRAGDGTGISHSCSLSRLGDWPLYVPIYKNRGCLIGWLSVSNSAAGNIQGEPLHWIKNSFADKFYPDGFTVSLQPVGSTYTNSMTNSVIPFTNGVALFTGGDLYTGGSPIFDALKVRIIPLNSFRAEEGTENLALSLQAGTGIVSGHFTDLATSRSAPIAGVVLQQQQSILGYFISTNKAGYFGMSPR
ncbi:MAG: hypothetical protein C5B50_18270 [Verrucomicrobia bacterium]|nr:MAG: hypothetical protein C5B50_18270 [Verrucomicrobiota bacterium]